jgi:anti-sigma B factor antagonist
VGNSDKTSFDQARDEVPVVVLQGELDLAQAPAMQRAIEDLLASGHSVIVVDLLDVTFMDSTALGVLVAALGRCRAAGGELHLILTEPRVLKVLEITGLADSFPLHPSRTGVAFLTGEASAQ